MRVGRFVSVLVGAGVVVMSCGLVLSEGDAADEDPPSTTVPEPTSSLDESLPSDSSPDAPVDESTTTSDVTTSTTVTPPETTSIIPTDGTSAETSSTPPNTSTTTTVTTTTSMGEPTRLAEAALRPVVSLRGLCATGSPRVFVFAASNLGTDTVDVGLVLKGTTLQTLTLMPGEVAGFRTSTAGTVSALVAGATLASADSATVPCPVSAGHTIGFGGLCHDSVAGYEWLLGNSGPSAVDVEVRMAGTSVGTFTLALGGFAGFTTPTGGQAQAYVGGVKVAEAQASLNPCIDAAVQLGDPCFDRDTRLYRWFVYGPWDAVVTVEFELDGVPVRQVTVSPSEGFFDFTTKTGGTGDLVLDGRVVARVVSKKQPCGSPVSIVPVCADAASGSIWRVSNQGPIALVVSVVLDGVHVATETLPARQGLRVGERELRTEFGARLELFAGNLLMADSQLFAEFSGQPCVSVGAICTDAVDGHVWQLQVWQLQAARPVRVELRVGGSSLGFFDLSPDRPTQAASTLGGSAQIYIDGIALNEADASDAPCVELFTACVDATHGAIAHVFNRRNVAVHAEVRIGGATVRSFDLQPFGAEEFADPRVGTMQLVLHGQVVANVPTATNSCGSPVDVSGFCSDEAHGSYWGVGSERFFPVSVELRQGDHRVGTLLLQPFDFVVVVSRDARDLQAVVDGVGVAEAPSSNDPCFDTPLQDAIVLAAEESAPTSGGSGESGGILPATGGGRDGAIPVALVLLAAGASALLVTRRRSVHK